MKKFKYRIESYLKFVKHQREMALKELKRAEAYRDELKDQYRLMEERVKKAYEINSNVGVGGHDIQFINDNNQFMKKLKTQMESLSIEISHAEQEYERKYKALLELQVKVKKLEHHKDLEKEKHRKEYLKKIQKVTDEINNTRKRGA